MSTSSTTPDSPTTDARPDGDDTTATDRAATASDRLWAALHARPGGTADELSGDAGIGRSTAAKILARWATDGTAVRVPPTDGKRSASRYAVPASGDTATPDGTDDVTPAPSDPTDAAAKVTDGPGGGATTGGTDGAHNGSTDDDAAADGLSGAEVPADSSRTTPDLVPESDDDAKAADAGSAPMTVEPEKATQVPGTVRVRQPRLAPGALHGMVEDYLRDHPDEEFGPTKIGHDLGRSTGAVSNALERLVTSGYAVRTKDRPKRYALAPATDRSADDPHGAGDGIE